MRISTQRNTFSLSAEGIDLLSEWLDEVCADVGVERQTRMRTRLLIEELMLRMLDAIGDQMPVVAVLDAKFGRPRLRIDIEGKAFNPLAVVETELGDWDSSLRTAIGLTPQYNYDRGKNILRLLVPHASMNPVLRLALAVAIGVSLGMVGRWIMPVPVKEFLVNGVLVPVYDMWNRLLNAISGPIIFLTVITTMLNMRRIEEKGGSGIRVVIRYFALSILTVVIATAIVLPLHPLPAGDELPVPVVIVRLFDGVLSTVPNNISEPFESSNTSQLLFLAFALGYLLIKLGNRMSLITKVIREANVGGLQVAEWVSYTVAFFVGFFLCMELLQGETDMLRGIWLPLCPSIIVSAVVLCIVVLGTASYMRVSPLLLVKKIKKPFVIALRTGSLNESFSEVELSCTRYLGIDDGYTKEALPQGLVLYMPISAVGTIIFTVYTAQQNGVSANLTWYIMAVVMAVVVFVATPPVPGANLLAYVVLFATLGIPESALLDAMIFDVVFGIVAGAGNQAMLQLEMLVQASGIGLLNQDRLKADIK